eukprot:14056963-Alexandrium_andersonii.AAC.1
MDEHDDGESPLGNDNDIDPALRVDSSGDEVHFRALSKIRVHAMIPLTMGDGATDLPHKVAAFLRHNILEAGPGPAFRATLG